MIYDSWHGLREFSCYIVHNDLLGYHSIFRFQLTAVTELRGYHLDEAQRPHKWRTVTHPYGDHCIGNLKVYRAS